MRTFMGSLTSMGLNFLTRVSHLTPVGRGLAAWRHSAFWKRNHRTIIRYASTLEGLSTCCIVESTVTCYVQVAYSKACRLPCRSMAQAFLGVSISASQRNRTLTLMLGRRLSERVG